MTEFDGGMDAGVEAANQQPDESVDASVASVAGCDDELPPVVCPENFRIDYGVTSPCRILIAGNPNRTNPHIITLRATDLPEFSGGVFHWQALTPKIEIIGTNRGTSIRIKATGNDLSDSRDDQTIRVTRTHRDGGCSPIDRDIHFTVAKITFSKASDDSLHQYGFDDMDNDNSRDIRNDNNRISIKKADYTFINVKIEGGNLVGTDFDFLSDNNDVCTPVAPEAVSQFDLRINAGDRNGHTLLHAKAKCAGATSFRSIHVHVYQENIGYFVVGKFENAAAIRAGSPGIIYRTDDFAAHEGPANEKLKEAVAKFDIINLASGDNITEFSFESGTNELTYKLGGVPCQDYSNLFTAFGNCGDRVRIAIVPRMKSYYYLSQDAAIGATQLFFHGDVFISGRNMPITDIDNVTTEPLIVTGHGTKNSIINCAPTVNAYRAGARYEFPAQAWGGSQMIVIAEDASFDITRWTINHEGCHSAYQLADIKDDLTNTMYYAQDRTAEYRLRYCGRNLNYDPAPGTPVQTENQWETIH